jgi:hypothetical protein
MLIVETLIKISRGAHGLRPEGARELSPGFTLGNHPLAKTAL